VQKSTLLNDIQHKNTSQIIKNVVLSIATLKAEFFHTECHVYWASHLYCYTVYRYAGAIMRSAIQLSMEEKLMTLHTVHIVFTPGCVLCLHRDKESTGILCIFNVYIIF